MNSSETSPTVFASSTGTCVSTALQASSSPSPSYACPSPVSSFPRSYERAMAAMNDAAAAAAAAAAASAASVIFGPCGDVGRALPHAPPGPPVAHISHMRFPFARAPGEDQAANGDVVTGGGYSIQVVVWPDGHVEQVARSFEAESGSLPVRQPSLTRRSSMPMLPCTPPASDESNVLNTKSFQRLSLPDEDTTWEANDDNSGVDTAADDSSSVTTTKIGPCWTSSPSENDEQGDAANGSHFPDMEVLKEMLRSMFQTFRQDSQDSTPEEDTSAAPQVSNVESTTNADPEFLRSSYEKEGVVEIDDDAEQVTCIPPANTQDVEMRESSSDGGSLTGEEDMSAYTVESGMDMEVETEPEDDDSETMRSWAEQSPPPPPPPPPPPSQAQAHVAAFAASVSPQLPPGAVFFESDTYVADGADPEYVERMLMVRETATRAAEQAVSTARGSLSSYFGRYCYAGERRL